MIIFFSLFIYAYLTILLSKSLSIGYQASDEVQSIVLDRDGSLNLSDTINRGGVVIHPDNVVRLYGNVHHSYSLSTSISVNRYTQIQFIFTQVEYVHGVGICLFQEFGSSFQSDIKCVALKGGNFPSYQNVLIVNSGSINLDGDQLNLALRRPTSQSSTTGRNIADAPGDSNFAVDGNKNPIFNTEVWRSNTVTRTESEIRPWWVVDLEEERLIRKIVIYKRIDVYGDDLKNFMISLMDSGGNVIMEKTFSETAPPIFTFDNINVVGKSIKISLNGDDSRVLCLAEVEVYGSVFEFNLEIGQLFNLPETNFNRLAFIQDRSETIAENADLDYESSIFTNITILDGSHAETVRRVQPVHKYVSIFSTN